MVRPFRPPYYIRLWFLLELALLVGCDRPSASKLPESPPDTIPSKSSDDPFLQAKELQQHGDIDGAIAAYDRFLSRNPKDLGALGNRAQLLQSQGKWEAAMADYNDLLDIDPSNFPALTRRAKLLLLMGEAKAAITDYNLLLSHLPSDPELLNARAGAFLSLGDPNAALKDLQAVLKLRPGWDEAVLNRAAAWYALGDYDRSRADYEAVLAAKPNDSRAANGLGLVMQFGEGDVAGAEKQFQLAIFHDAKNAEAHYNMAYLDAGRGLTLKAIEGFGAALAVDADYVDAYLNRGLLRMQVRLYDDATADFAAAVARRPTAGKPRLLLGWAKCEAGRRAEGCIDLAAAKSMAEPESESLIQKYCQ